MMSNRVLLAKFSSDFCINLEENERATCGCLAPIEEGETVALYPMHDVDPNYRDIVCLTCHFWFTHYAAECEA